MKKKREKKRFSRAQVRISNVNFKDVDEYYEEHIQNQKKAAKKTSVKGARTQKRNVDLKVARVLEVHSNNICKIHLDKEVKEVRISGRLKQSSLNTRSIIAVGDFVHVDANSEYRIEEVLERENTLSRFMSDGFQTEVVLAANIDQVIITSAYLQPRIKLGLIDRYLCLAAINHITPVICINKIDLAESFEEVLEELVYYEFQGYKIIYTSVEENIGIDKLTKVLRGKESVFSGHSGAGKSSLINKIDPSLDLRVATVSDFNEKGRHTTTSSRLIPLSIGGYLVDTPGIKTFGLHKEHKSILPKVFPGFEVLANQCHFHDCSHTHEQDCAVKAAVDADQIPFDRYDSYLRILESL